MDPILRSRPGGRLPAAMRAVFLLLISLLALTGCDSLGLSTLERYRSEIAQIEVPVLTGWEVQFEQDGGAGTAFLTMTNEYSGVMVTRAPRAMLFPNQSEDAGVDVYLDVLIDLAEGTFVASGPAEEQKRSGYRQATASVEMEQVADLAGPSSGTLLLAMQDDQVVIALFYCSVDQLEQCEKDLARSVKGFRLIKP